MTKDSTPQDGLSRRTVLKASAVGASTLGMIGAAAASTSGATTNGPFDVTQPFDVITQTTDIVGQGADGDVVAKDGARIWRTSNAILMEVSMPRPTPGEYTYPSAPEDKKDEWWTDEAGALEAFTLWAFIFNNPEECENGCGTDDLTSAGGGVFGVTGHVFDGDTLTLNGMVSTDTEPFDAGSLTRPLEAAVHLAVAPHGAFKPEMLPEQLQTPASPSSVWWVAIFEPPV